MEIIKAEPLWQSVAAVVSHVRRVFRSAHPIPETLDRFCRLRDHLHRLLEAATDYPAETREVLEQHPRLLADVLDVLAFSAKLQAVSSLVAARAATEAANNSPLELEYFRQCWALTTA